MEPHSRKPIHSVMSVITACDEIIITSLLQSHGRQCVARREFPSAELPGDLDESSRTRRNAELGQIPQVPGQKRRETDGGCVISPLPGLASKSLARTLAAMSGKPWEAELPEGVSRLARIFNDPSGRMARLGDGSMYDPPREEWGSPRSRPQSASPRYSSAQEQSPRKQVRPGSAAIGGRPQSPRASSPRGSLRQSFGQGQGYAVPSSPRTMGQSYSGRARPQSAAAPSSPRIRELEETNDTLRRNYRLAQVEQENDALRRQLDQLKVAREYDPSNPMVKYSPRRAHRRANLPITGAMGHDQMVPEP